MTISVKHAFVSAVADGTDPAQISPSDWNEEHTVTEDTKALTMVTMSAAQLFPRMGSVRVKFDTITIGDVQNFSAADNRFTAPVAGIYLFNVSIGLTIGIGGAAYLLKNSVGPGTAIYRSYSNYNSTYSGTLLLELAAHDYVEVFLWPAGACSTITSDTFFQVCRV